MENEDTNLSKPFLSADVISLLTSILDFSVRFGIPAARDIVSAFQTPNPTKEDWDAAFENATKNSKVFLEETKDL